tara:strand:+ start:16039 stop:17247 length:1209 start_codon:yes stop_codon:yes gene_type:complete
MRILLTSDEFLPEGTRAHSKMIYELACQLKTYGHKSVVITPGRPDQSKRLKIDYINDIEVWRFRSGYTRGVGMVKRGINEFLLSFRAWFAIRKMVRINKFDLCINYSPTIFFGLLAWKLKKQGSYVYLVLRDMFPQWIIDRGLIKERSLVAYFFRFFESINYKTADRIGLQSNANLELFSKSFPAYENIEILMNWTNTEDTFQDDNYGIRLREELCISDKVLFFYGGNIGHAQDMTNIMRLAKNLKNIQQIHFLIVGDGDEYALINELRNDWSLDNVTILPSVPQNKFESILAASDIGLFSLAKEHSAHNFPGKVLGYLKAGKPILGSVNIGNDLLNIINDSNSGFVFKNGDDNLLKQAAKNLTDSPELRKKISNNGINLLRQKFSVNIAAKKILASVVRYK